MAVPGLAMAEEERRRREAMGMLPPEEMAGGGGAEPAPAPAPAVPLVMAPPTEQSKTVVTAKRASPESQQALREGEAAGVALLSAEQRRAQAEADQKKADNQAGFDIAKKEEEQAKGRADFQRQHLEWLKKVDEYAERDVKAATQRVEQNYQASQKGYWADKPWYAKVLGAIAVAASRRNLRIMGENPNASGVQAAIDDAVEQDKKAKEANLLKSKEYLTLAKARPEEARKLHEKRLKEFDAEQAAELTLVQKEAAKLKASKAVDPALVDAEADKLIATAQEKYAKSKLDNRQHYEATVARTDVDGTPGAGKPASEATREVVTGSELFDKLAARQREIIQQNGGKIPLMGELAQEFETNDKRMATIQQKPLGKSDADAAAARKLQATPGPLEYGRQALGSDQPVKNYLKSLDVNSKALRDQAESMAAGEGKLNPSARTAPAPASPAAQDVGALTKRYTAAIARAKAAGDNAAVKELQQELAREVSKSRKKK